MHSFKNAAGYLTGKILLRLFCFIAILSSCSPTERISRQDFSAEYTSAENNFKPELLIYHSDSLQSHLIIHIPENAALSMRDSDLFVSRIKVKYELFNDYNSKIIVDSASKIITKSSLNNSAEILDSMTFKAATGKKLIMKINIRDLNRNYEVSKVMIVNKINNHTRQNYLLLSENSQIQFRNYILKDEHFKIFSADGSDKKFYVRCYFHRYPLAPPPFKLSETQIFSYKADSTFSVVADSVSSLSLNRYGFYHFQTDTSTKDGFTVFQYTSDFPLITNPAELVEPTRYLTSNSEFKDLINAKDKRAAIDQFWINIAGNKEKARDLIREYYGRVQIANSKFSSYTEGWKTDRGLIYIIFGAPSSVYFDDATESWNYMNQPSMPDVTFTFKRMNNPFTENDYTLIRQPYYDNSYYMAVEQWRQGRILNNR